MECRFCGSPALRQTHRGVSHPKKRDHGPFDLYACSECGSVGTWPLPTPEDLAALYGSFSSGVEATLRDLRAATPLSSWFGSVVRRVAELGRFTRDSKFRWIDVGAGGGELAELMAHEFPHATGTAIDWAPRPMGIDPIVEWRVADLNDPAFTAPPADLVVSLSVWEHVLDPSAYVRTLHQLVAPGGLLYLVCPDAGSLAARVLGTWWPYFLPGEHLNMPTLHGARRCVEQAMGPGDTVSVAPVGLPYPPAYVLGFLGLARLSRLARPLPSVPLPVGALEAVCRRPRV